MTVQLVVIPSRPTRSNHAEIARAIGTAIIRGDYPAGARLPGDAELTDRFGVSRPVLRESLKTLAAKGLLSAKTRVGTVIRSRDDWNMFDPDMIAWHLEVGIGARFLQDLADIRLAVEPQAAALAARRRTEADLQRLSDAIGRMAAAAPTPAPATAFAEADLELHLAVAEASRNPFMRSVGAVIEAALRASLILSAPVDEHEYDLSVQAHGAIVAAIAAQDGAAASAAMRHVIETGLRRHGQAGSA